MKRKSFILILFLLISLGFLFVQIIFLKSIYFQPSGSLSSWSGPLFSSKNVSPQKKMFHYGIIRLFINVTESAGAGVFLVDPTVLRSVVNSKVRGRDLIGSNDCRHLCQSNNISFAVLAESWKTSKVLPRLGAAGFAWTSWTGADPRLASTSGLAGDQIPLHYIFRLHASSLHLVVFYQRPGNFWWHGQLGVTQDQGSPPSLELGHHPGAYSKTEIVRATVDRLRLYLPKHPGLFLDQVGQSHFVECDYQRAAAFGQAYGQDNSQEALDFRRDALEVLVVGARVLDELGVRFWLSSGTCLGWFRECNIIGHGRDVDFGIWITDYNTQIMESFETNGFTLKHQFGKIEDSFELSFIGKGGIKLDLFFFYEEDDTMWNGGTDVKDGKKYKYVFPKFSLRWTELLGTLVRVPYRTQPYIEANYGKEWNQPVREWSWKHSPPNVRENGAWDPSQWDQLIQIH